MKRCTKCKRIKPFDEFSLDRQTRDGRRSWCRVCSNQYNIQHRRSCLCYENKIKKKKYEKRIREYDQKVRDMQVQLAKKGLL